MAMINGNVDSSYSFPEEEKGLYHVSMDQRVPLGGMEYEDINRVQKFHPKEFDRFENNKAISGGFFNRRILHNPEKKTVVLSTDYYEGKSKAELLTFIRDMGEVPASNIGKTKLIELYEKIKEKNK